MMNNTLLNKAKKFNIVAYLLFLYLHKLINNINNKIYSS